MSTTDCVDEYIHTKIQAESRFSVFYYWENPILSFKQQVYHTTSELRISLKLKIHSGEICALLFAKSCGERELDMGRTFPTLLNLSKVLTANV